MNCPKCGAKLESGYEGECECPTKGCEHSREDYEAQEAKGFENTFLGSTYRACGEQWQERAEKAEAELKSLRNLYKHVKAINKKEIHK